MEKNKKFASMRKFLNRDINEFNKFYLSLFCALFLIGAAILSYKISDSSYAIFSNIIEGKENINLTVTRPSLDESGANAPVLSNNMIPVYFNESDSTWRKADSENLNKNYKWYDYNKKMWANSVTVSSTRRSTYLNASLGTIIPMDDILTMQVWIPRYKYKIFNYNENGETYVQPQEIEITFEKGVVSTGEVKCIDSVAGTSDGTKTGSTPDSSETCYLKKTNATCTDEICNSKTYTHPAFTFGNEELPGMWVGKFEFSGTPNSFVTKPDTQSLRAQAISVFATNIMNMKNTNNIYGFSTLDDTHMMKNMEWGAVTYLTQSKYGMCTSGICKEINVNNSSMYYTGRSGGGVSGNTAVNTVYPEQTSTEKYNNYGFYTYDGYLLTYGTNIKSSTRNLTKVASTTGNIYGVYDMSGGSWEYVMANMISFDGITMISGDQTSTNSGYTGMVSNYGDWALYSGTYEYPNDKYYDKYSFNNEIENRIMTKLGDAIREVGSSISTAWYGDDNVAPSYARYSWIGRGGYYNYYGGAGYGGTGIFNSGDAHGSAVNTASTRLVIVPSGS